MTEPGISRLPRGRKINLHSTKTEGPASENSRMINLRSKSRTTRCCTCGLDALASAGRERAMSRQLAEHVYCLGGASREDALPGTQTGGAHSGANPSQSLHPGFVKIVVAQNLVIPTMEWQVRLESNRLLVFFAHACVLLRRRCARCAGECSVVVSCV